MPKKSIREKILEARRALESEHCQLSSVGVQERFIATPEFAHAEFLALYSSVHCEVHTDLIMQEALHLGKRIAFPRVRGSEMDFMEVSDPSQLRPGTFGVLEPVGDEILSLSCLDLIVVPGVAFDRCGHRLGYGKGFYDRVLEGRSGGQVLAGVAFEFQLVDSLPAEPHDVQMELVVTEKSTLRFA